MSATWSRVWKRDKRRTERLDAAQSFPGSKAAGLRCQLGFPWARAPETRQVPWNCTRCAVQLLKQEEASTTASKYCAPFRKSCRRRGRDVSFEEICSWPLIGFDERSGLTPLPRERDETPTPTAEKGRDTLAHAAPSRLTCCQAIEASSMNANRKSGRSMSVTSQKDTAWSQLRRVQRGHPKLERKSVKTCMGGREAGEGKGREGRGRGEEGEGGGRKGRGRGRERGSVCVCFCVWVWVNGCANVGWVGREEVRGEGVKGKEGKGEVLVVVLTRT